MSRTFTSNNRRPPPRVERGFEPRDRSIESERSRAGATQEGEFLRQRENAPPRVEEAKEQPANEAPRRGRLVEKYVEFTEDNLPKRGESYEEWRWRLAAEESLGLLLI
jgi:hypothetical protein